MEEILESLRESLTALLRSILRIGYLHTIDEVTVSEPRHNDGLVVVNLRANGRHVYQYLAYLVENSSFDEYMEDSRQKDRAALKAKGRFVFPEENKEDNLRASFLSLYTGYMGEVMEKHLRKTIESQIKARYEADRKGKFTQLARSGGVARSTAVHEYYEGIRPIVDSILKESPELSDHRVANRLNQLGQVTMNGKIWRDTTVQAMREYLANNEPSHSQGLRR